MVRVSFQQFLSDILIYLEIFAPHCVNPYEGIHRQIPHFICDNKISFDLHALLSLDVNCYRIELWWILLWRIWIIIILCLFFYETDWILNIGDSNKNPIMLKYFSKESSYLYISWKNTQIGKGQLLSKCLGSIFDSPKKRTKKFDFTTKVPQVELFSFIFWENWRHQKDISKLTDL